MGTSRPIVQQPRPVPIERGFNDGETTRDQYDAAGRLHRTIGPRGENTYRYDRNNNMIRKTTPSAETTYEYDRDNKLLRQEVNPRP
jgi:YD repeat-containing protein